MFGNRKMYKRGLADAMQGIAGFSEKQQAALEKLRQDVESGGKRLEDALTGLGDEINGIYQYLNSREKAALYRLETSLDLKDLEEPEQQLLLAILYQLADDEGNKVTDNQRTFIRSIQRYMGITNPQTSADLTAVGDIDSLDVQKTFLRVALEFFYLQEGEEITEDQEDFLGNFSVNKKQAGIIENSVSRLYNAVGAEGIAEKYGFTEEPEDAPDAEDEETTECYGLTSPVSKEYIFDDSNRDILVGAERIFENMRVIFPKQLHIDGKAIFKNCEIVFDFDGKIAIFQRESGSVSEFRNCEFIIKTRPQVACISIMGKCLIRDSIISGQTYQYGMRNDQYKNDDGTAITYNSSFFDVDGYSDGHASLTMEHCLVENCTGTFINADGNVWGDNHKVTLLNCQVTGHTGNFLLAQYPYRGSDTGVVIKDCTFKDCRPLKTKEDIGSMSFTDQINFDNTYPGHDCLLATTGESFTLENSHFLSVQENQFEACSTVFGDAYIHIVNCVFEDFVQTKPIFGIVEGCTFRRLANDPSMLKTMGAMVDPSYGGLIFGNCGEFDNHETIVRNVKFQEIHGRISLQYGKIEHCIFEDSEMMLSVLGKGDRQEYYISEANDLTFVNCSVLGAQNKRYDFNNIPALIQAVSYLNKNKMSVSIFGCKFKHCTIPGGCKAVNTELREIGAFSRIKNLIVGREWDTEIL